MKVAVVGGGSWGTTVAHLCAHNAPTTLYSRRPEVAEAINERHENPRYLPGYELHPELRCVSDLAAAVNGADLVVMAVASQGFRETLIELRNHIGAGVPVVSLTKGLERESGKRMTELIVEELPGHPAGVLTGPNLAKEVLAGDAAAAVVAMEDPELADRLQSIFSTNLFRVYTNPDIIGCELGGALKNVIAIAVGISFGLGTGDNTRAAVITRGLAELTRLGVAMGGEAATFAGLAGMGDLVATCLSSQSRNRTVGEELGKGRSLDEIIDEMQQVAEGVKSATVVCALGERFGVELPISEEIRAVVTEGRTAEQAYRGLLRRPQQPEMDLTEPATEAR